jgi:dephospho-CoA kinase
MDNRKFKIAVTGGIGAGKSEFCSYLKEKGYPVIYADVIARDIITNNKEVIPKIKAAFGEKAYLNNEPDIKYLSDAVFSNPEKVRKINSIIHPFVIDAQNRVMDNLLKENDFVFLEAALIYEAEVEDEFNYIVLITSENENKIQRILKQRGLSETEITKRINNQIPDKLKKEWADFIFENNGSLAELKTKAEWFLTLLKSMRGTN